MSAIWLGMLAALKYIVLKVASEKFFVWLTMAGARALAASTKTPYDDIFVNKVQEALDG